MCGWLKVKAYRIVRRHLEYESQGTGVVLKSPEYTQ